jgi:hypothetical protein
MTDPRDEFSPYWLQTVVPFGAAREPQGSRAGTLWEQHPLLLQALAATIDASKLPVPPYWPPLLPSFPTSYPSVDKAPAWMVSAAAPINRRILGQFSQLAEQPLPEPWNRLPDTALPDASALPIPPVRAPAFPPSPLNGSPYQEVPYWLQTALPVPSAVDDDPFARAARRTRQSVQPPFGRRPGVTTALLQNVLPATAEGMATLPQRAIEAAGNLQRTGEYDAGPGFQAAMLTVGLPTTPAGALGAAARRPSRLPMDEASRMARADSMGFRRNMPLEYGSAPAGEKIAAAAFNVNGRIFTAPMHYEALENAEQALGVPYSQMQHAPIPEGFVTNTGRYVSRWEAADIARRARQAEGTGIWGDELTSEDTAMSGIKPSSKVRTATTAPGLPGGQGVWGWVLPGEAASIPPSALRPRTPRRTAMANSGIQGTEEAVIPPAPIWHRAERLFPLDARDLRFDEIQASLKEAWNQGHDAVMLRNYTAPGGRSGDILVVKDPAQLRFPTAKFDPRKRNSSDLSASIAALLGPGVAVHVLNETMPPESSEAFWDAWRRGDAR